MAAGQSGRGCQFAAEHADFNFVIGPGRNAPDGHAAGRRLGWPSQTAKTGRDVGSYVLTMVIADETDAAAWAKWEHYKAGADTTALAWMAGSGRGRQPGPIRPRTPMPSRSPEGAVNFNMGTFIGSYATVARMLDASGRGARDQGHPAHVR